MEERKRRRIYTTRDEIADYVQEYLLKRNGQHDGNGERARDKQATNLLRRRLVRGYLGWYRRPQPRPHYHPHRPHLAGSSSSREKV